MSRFFIGQRIKKSRGGINEGATARISDKPLPAIDRLFGLDLVVVIDEDGVSCDGTHVKAGTHCTTFEDEWEPILDPGAQPSEFKSLHELLDSLEGAHT